MKIINKILTKFNFRFVKGLGIYRIIDPFANVRTTSKNHGRPFGVIKSIDPLKKIKK